MSTSRDRDWQTLADALDVTTETAARDGVEAIATDLRVTLRWQATGSHVEQPTHELAQEVGAPERSPGRPNTPNATKRRPECAALSATTI